jgi:hypothetical protein
VRKWALRDLEAARFLCKKKKKKKQSCGSGPVITRIHFKSEDMDQDKCCGTVTIYCGSVSDFVKVLFLVPFPSGS